MRIIDQQLYNYAGQGNTLECLAALVRGADVNATNEHGWSVLHFAAWRGHVDACRLLIERGANIHAVDEDGWCALHSAAYFGRSDVCLLLFERGCNHLATTREGGTALDLATENDKEECIGVLRVFAASETARAALREIACGNTLKAMAP